MMVQRAARRDGWWYPYIFVGGFGIVLVVNMALMYFATSTFNGLETSRAYEKGLAYNDEIAAAEAQAELGWQAELAVTTAQEPPGGAARTVVLTLSLSDREARPVDGLAIEATVRRPTVAWLDQSVTLAPVGPGRYAATMELPMAGQWDLLAVATRGEDAFRLRERMVLN